VARSNWTNLPPSSACRDRASTERRDD